MPDVALQVGATQALPLDYKVPGGQEIVLKTMRAHIDGTGAGGSFIPAVILRDAFGNEAGCYTLGSTLAAGASADVSWFPGVKAAAASGASVTPWPAADQANATLDNSTYANNVSGSGDYETLVFPAGSGSAAFAMAQAGDTYPRVLVGSNPDIAGQGFLTLGDGTVDPTQGVGVAAIAAVFGAAGSIGLAMVALGAIFLENLTSANIKFDTGAAVGGAIVEQVLALSSIQKQALHTYNQTKILCGYGVPVMGADGLNDIYIRQDGGAGTTLYRATAIGAAGVATWAAFA